MNKLLIKLRSKTNVSDKELIIKKLVPHKCRSCIGFEAFLLKKINLSTFRSMYFALKLHLYPYLRSLISNPKGEGTSVEIQDW